MYSPDFLPELQKRWKAVQKEMTSVGADGLWVTSNVNLLYFSGRVYNGALYIPVEGNPAFFVRRPIDLKGENVVYIRKFEDVIDWFSENKQTLPNVILFENDSITYSEYMRFASIFSKAEIRNGTSSIRKVRNIKSPFEIEQLRVSCERQAAVYKMIPSLYKPGMTETDLSIEIEREFRKHGSLGIFRIFGQSMEIFMGSILAGDNADAPSPYDFTPGGAGLHPSIPIGGSGTPLTEGISVMVDVGGNFTGYISDMSRVFSVGCLPELGYKAHQVALDIQEAVVSNSGPGTLAADLYHKAVEIADQNALSDYFMGHCQKAGFIGHGIGLEINEGPVLAPRSKEILEKGMVFALEPKFVIPGIGAVGIENSFVVTSNGVDKITIGEEAILPLG